MTLPSHKKEFLAAVGYTSEEIAAVETTMAQMAQKAQQQGVRSKEVTEAAPAAPAEPVTPAAPAAQEPVQKEPQAPEGEDQLKQATELMTKALEPILAPLTAKIATLESQLAALQAQGTTSLTPAASGTIVAKSIAQQPGEHVLSGRSPDKGPKENNSDKEGPQASLTGIPLLDNILAANHAQQTQAN